MRWSHGLGMDLTLIEVMPMGEIEVGRVDQYPAALGGARAADGQATRWIDDPPIAPAGRRVTSASRRPAGSLGFITPLTHTSARAATGCASPAPARSICASGRRMPPIF